MPQSARPSPGLVSEDDLAKPTGDVLNGNSVQRQTMEFLPDVRLSYGHRVLRVQKHDSGRLFVHQKLDHLLRSGRTRHFSTEISQFKSLKKKKNFFLLSSAYSTKQKRSGPTAESQTPASISNIVRMTRLKHLIRVSFRVPSFLSTKKKSIWTGFVFFAVFWHFKYTAPLLLHLSRLI